MNEIKEHHRKRTAPRARKVQRTALDSLASLYRKEIEEAERTQLLESSDENTSEPEGSIELLSDDSRSFSEGTRFAKHTGIFTQDFLPTPKVSKGEGKKVSHQGVNDVSLSSSQSMMTTTQLESPAPAADQLGKECKGSQNEVATNTSFSSEDMLQAPAPGLALKITLKVMVIRWRDGMLTCWQDLLVGVKVKS